MRLWSKAGWIGNQKGNVFAMIFAGVAMVGVMGVATMNLVVGPATTVTKVTNQNMAQNDLLMNAKVVVMNAATRPNGGDEDEDGYIEPVPFIPTSEESCNITLPGEGGCLPMDIGAIQTDPWGTQYAYCVWDHGTETGSENRIAGEDSTSGAVIAIISAGPNRQFETPCLPYDGDPETNDIGINPDGLGDDLVQIFTYAGAVSGSGGLWELKQGEPTTAVTAKDVEVDGAFRMGFAGEDPGQVGLASCTDMNHIGRMRFNPLDKAIEVCVFNGNYGWETLAGESTGGGQVGTLTQKAGLDGRIFPDAIICINNNIPRVFWFAADNTASSKVSYRFTFSSGDVISIHYSSATGLYLDYFSTSTLTVAVVADAADPCRTSVQAVTLAGRSYNLADGSAGHLTMVPGWPDAIVCKPSSGTWDDIEWILYRMFGRDSISNHAYRSLGTSSESPRYIRLNMNSDGSFHRLLEIITGSSPATDIDGDCAGKTISQLYADGQAFNFVGGSSGGSSAEGVDATGMIVAFASDTCPAGWSEYTPARGRFLRGIDPTGTIDPDGTRSPGHVQNYAIAADHFNTTGWRETTGGHFRTGFVKGMNQDNNDAGQTHFQKNNWSSETRPKNVAVTFCRFDGEGVLLGGGAGGEGDNLGDHTATQNLDLSVNKLVGEGGTDGIYINSNGHIGIGTVAPETRLHIRAEGAGVNNQLRFDSSGGPHDYVVYHSNGTLSAPTSVVAGNRLIGIRAFGYGSTGYSSSDRARIEFLAAENWTDSAQGTHIGFRTTASGSIAMAERVRITADGNVGIGTTTPITRLEVSGHISTRGGDFNIQRPLTSGGWARGVHLLPDGSNSPTTDGLAGVGFYGSAGNPPHSIYLTHGAIPWTSTNGIHILSSGHVGIGTATPSARLDVNGSLVVGPIGPNGSRGNTTSGTHISSAGYGWFARNSSANAAIYLQQVAGSGMLADFTGGTTFVGSITTNGSSTFYNTTSDYRLKNDILPLEGALDRLMKLKPAQFRFRSDDRHETVDGFIAHEVQDIAPYAVTGAKDDMDDKGDPIYQSMDYGRLTPLLSAAVQELKSFFDELSARMAELFDSVANLRAELTSQNAAIETLKVENAALRSDLSSLQAANDNLRRELDELKSAIGE